MDESPPVPQGAKHVEFLAKRGTTRRARVKPLTEKQRLIARLHVQGCSLQEIADRAPLTRNGTPPPRTHIWKVLQDERVQDYVARLSRTLEEQLGELEHEAVPVARDLLYDPDPDIRLKTYQDLLNRMGRRGKPMERVAAQHLTLQGDLDSYIAGVLADPGVETLLAAQPELKVKLLAKPEPDGQAAP